MFRIVGVLVGAAAMFLLASSPAPAQKPFEGEPTPQPAPSAAAQTPDDVVPAHAASSPGAPAVTAATLLESERFWPYHVRLESAWTPPRARDAIPAGAIGVLVRVESRSLARVDFGRHGLVDAPIEKTDLVARANAIRLGQEEKRLPNLVEAIGPRLLASEGDALEALPLSFTYAHDGFLCVFADPSAEGFPDLAVAMTALPHRAELLTILFPQGRKSDAAVRERLRASGWKVPFVYQHLAEPYTRTLIGDAAVLPRISLLSPEGRLLFDREWRPDTITALRAAIEDRFAASAPASESAQGALSGP
jgi:hypothetical protein